jgi:hypothetical protein
MNVANQLIGISSAAEAQIVHVAEEQSKSAAQHTTDQPPYIAIDITLGD